MNRLKFALRNIIRFRLNSAIIVFSLALGIACSNLIALFVSKEYNVDRFQKNYDRMYALQADNPFNKGERMYYIRAGAAEYMKNNFSEVEDFCRISDASPIKVIVGRNNYFDNPNVIKASSNFFSFFSYQLSLNTPKNVLASSQDIVISQELAEKYFGKANPVGQRITLIGWNSQSEMLVSGVFVRSTESTVLNFDMVRLIDESDSQCFLRLAENTNIAQLEGKFAQNKAVIPVVHSGTPGTHYLRNLQDTYFDTSRTQSIENSRNKADLIIASVIALMVLAVGLFNYFGLMANRLMDKTKEHTIRLVNGGSGRNLLGSFMLEISILVGLAFILSLAIMVGIMPFFNHLTSSSIIIPYLYQLKNAVLLTGIPLFILLVSCLYAAIRIGKGVKVKLLKPGSFHYQGKSGFPVYILAQLSISVILIIGSLVVMKQINFITNKEIGLNKETLEIKIPLQHKDVSTIFKSELEKQASVEIVSKAQASPLLSHYKMLFEYDDNGTKKQYMPAVSLGDEHYLSALEIKIINGTGFSENGESNRNKYIINESLAKFFPGRNLLGNELPGVKNSIVIGIAKDFHYSSLKESIAPGCIVYDNASFNLMVKPVHGQEQQARSAILKIWNKYIPDFPLNMESVGDRYAWLHRENANYVKLIGSCCFLSVLLSMIGLFAVSFQRSRRRIKEIGIRKVNGARTTEVMAMLNSDFIKWVAIAFIIACPIAWYAMHQWLQNFAYKTELSWWVFALAGILALAVALLTVSWQSWRAATRNPVESLRYE